MLPRCAGTRRAAQGLMSTSTRSRNRVPAGTGPAATTSLRAARSRSSDSPRSAAGALAAKASRADSSVSVSPVTSVRHPGSREAPPWGPWSMTTGTLEGGIGRNPEGRGALTFYVHVQNLEATLAQVEGAGGTTLRERLQVGPNVSIALFGDPDGNVVGLMEEA